MAITIDSISPNSVCIDEYKKNEAPPQAKPCEIDVVVSLSDRAASYQFKFIKEGIRFKLSNSSNATDVALLMQSGWNPEDQNLQALFLQSIPLNWVWRVNYHERYLKNQSPIANADQVLQWFSDFLGFGAFQEGSPNKQQETFSKILQTMPSLNAAEKKFIQQNLSSQLQEGNRIFGGVVERMEVLKALAEWSLLFDQTFSLVLGDDGAAKVFQSTEKDILGHLFLASPDFEKIKGSLRKAALQANQSEVNFYEKLVPLLQAFEANPTLQKQSLFQTRVSLLKQWISQPARSEEVRYGALSEKEAVEQSILDSLSNLQAYESLAKNVSDVVEPPQLEPEWFGNNGNLKEIVHAIVQSVILKEQEDGTFLIDEAAFRGQGFALTQLLSNHSIQDREFSGGVYAVLIHLFAQPPQSEVQWRVYWKGEVRTIKVKISPENQKNLESSYRFLNLRIKNSLTNTQTILPWAEAGACVAGLGVAAWGVKRSQEQESYYDPVMLSGSGVAGFGCGALGTHFLYPTRNPYISDGVGAAIGLVLGLGAPLLMEQFRSKGGDGDMLGPRPIEAKNPTTDFGP